MADKRLTDAEIIKAIITGGLARKKVLEDFFKREKLKKIIIKQVSGMGGSANDADDVFQEAMIIFDRNIRDKKFKEKSSLETYFVSIAKWYWLSQRRKLGRETELNPNTHDSELESHENSMFKKDRRQLLDQALQQLGKRCQLILTLWGENFSMKEIATQADLMKDNNPDEVRAKKEAYRCRKRLRDFVQSQPKLLESLSALR